MDCIRGWLIRLLIGAKRGLKAVSTGEKEDEGEDKGNGSGQCMSSRVNNHVEQALMRYLSPCSPRICSWCGAAMVGLASWTNATCIEGRPGAVRTKGEGRQSGGFLAITR